MFPKRTHNKYPGHLLRRARALLYIATDIRASLHGFIVHALGIDNTSDLLDDGSGKEITRDVDGGTETVKKPIDGDNDSEHTGNLDVDRIGNHDDENERGRGDRGGADGCQGSQNADHDIVDRAEVCALSDREEDDSHGKVDGSAANESVSEQTMWR